MESVMYLASSDSNRGLELILGITNKYQSIFKGAAPELGD
jgi:hypothetical protein